MKQWNVIAIVVLERRLEKNVIVLQYFNSIVFSVFIEYKNFKKNPINIFGHLYGIIKFNLVSLRNLKHT